MMKECSSNLNKRTMDWVEIRSTLEVQLTVSRNWNLPTPAESKARYDRTEGCIPYGDLSVSGQHRTSYSRGQRKEVSSYNCDKKVHFARDCPGLKRRNPGQGSAMNADRVKKILQDYLVQCNKIPGNFQ